MLRAARANPAAKACSSCSSTPSRLRSFRSLWTTRTIASDDAQDLLANLPVQHIETNSVALYTLSRNLPREALSTIVQHFQNLNSKAIGCVSHGSEDGSGPFSLSYAIHQPPQNRLELAIPFRSEISGTPKIALGREVVHSRLQRDISSAEWAGDASVAAEEVPKELQGIKPDSVNQIIYFSDEQPQGLMKSLDAEFPAAVKLGLLASSTPFATGRPHTLLYGKEIFSTGAVGVAICRSPSFINTKMDLSYDTLAPLGDSLEVTHSKGNIILELASTNATRLLLERIQKGVGTVIDKEKGFYLGILPQGKQEATIDEMISIRPIIAGDPSRGALSLDTEANIVPGQHVQFFHTSSEAPPSQKQSKASSLVFRKESGRQGDAQTSSPAFTASSEHGFVVGRPGNGSWVCSVDHSRASVHI